MHKRNFQPLPWQQSMNPYKTEPLGTAPSLLRSPGGNSYWTAQAVHPRWDNTGPYKITGNS